MTCRAWLLRIGTFRYGPRWKSIRGVPAGGSGLGATPKMVRFELNERKAVEALVWLANAQPGITFYYVVKVLFFADKIHLNKYGRPILGDQYVAMEHGPVPSTVYNMLKHDPFLGPDLRKAVKEALSIDDTRVKAIRKPDMEVFSKSDIECLKESLSIFGHMSFGTLKRVSHDEKAYSDASANSEMDYIKMIDEENPHKDAIVKRLKELSKQLAF